MVFLKLEKLGVLENGVLFIAAVIIMAIILFLLLFLVIFMTSRSLYDLALAHPSEFSILDCPLAHLAVGTPVFTLSSSTACWFLPQDLCFCCPLRMSFHHFLTRLHPPVSSRLSAEVTFSTSPSLPICSEVVQHPPPPEPCHLLSHCPVLFSQWHLALLKLSCLLVYSFLIWSPTLDS